jgi:glycosyltransferase involved in cell wall biosynthesis
MKFNDEKLLTIISTTKNCERDIGRLIESLNDQISKSFTWLVIDGGSTDETLNIIKRECKVSYTVINSKDFSIYHAINIGVENIKSNYYAIAGADDFFDHNFVQVVCSVIKKDKPDLIFGSVIINSRVVRARKGYGWLKGMHGVGSSHSIGSVVKKDLHGKNGLYSKMYPIVADQYFIKKCVYSDANAIRLKDIFGTYSVGGFSSINGLHYQLDFFKMQIETEKNFLLQYILFSLRLFKFTIIRHFK